MHVDGITPIRCTRTHETEPIHTGVAKAPHLAYELQFISMGMQETYSV